VLFCLLLLGSLAYLLCNLLAGHVHDLFLTLLRYRRQSTGVRLLHLKTSGGGFFLAL
jgi:hypothetical protein